ncbi:competence type IV pilus major pilin ComGC [Aquibacillus rhizosphaerae]|uniref:ComG operon protein 3 n=1 Tax=Aquibacillus rhizosphaerae TaxID=3051431 RepID=A0ABT7L6T3_9BACI|nr:competence type IV pilus major pilin ComGC [Aquibacillus sp. LR5S19]MDL4841558.1 competence type IV pilus major pilin ComGC [Aquibacillus sp. LR5S19]
MENEKAFTLIEMLIVLTIISTLLILLIPNLADKNEQVQNKGCDALVQMAENQLQSYKIDNGSAPQSVTILISEGYLKKDTCANGTKKIQLTEDKTKPIEVVVIE